MYKNRNLNLFQSVPRLELPSVAISVRIDIFSRIELSLQTSCQMKRLITRMTFNSFLSCLMSKESMEITINTCKWHERAKQWNGNSHISSLKLTGSHFIVILFTLQCQLYI